MLMGRIYGGEWNFVCPPCKEQDLVDESDRFVVVDNNDDDNGLDLTTGSRDKI